MTERGNPLIHLNIEEAVMEISERVEEVLAQVRPALEAHGGSVQLVEVTEDGVVQVRLEGACKGCPMSQMTLSMGIEAALKEQIPEVKSVVAVD